MHTRSLLWLGLAGLALAAFLLSLPSAQASAIDLATPTNAECHSGCTLREGQALDITVRPTEANPPERFSEGDRIVVTDPSNCQYAVAATPGTAPVRVTYPSAFDPVAGNAASCPADAHTGLASTYQVDFVAADLESQEPYIRCLEAAECHATFEVLLTERKAYLRTEVVRVAAIGFAPNGAVNVQFDRPGTPSQPYHVQSTTADELGRVTASFVLPKGIDAGGIVDVGEWTVRIVPVGSSPKVEDRQTFIVGPSPIQVSWAASSVPTTAGRTSAVAINASIVYQASLGNPEPVHLVSSDVSGGLVDLVLAKDGETIQTPTASYDAATKTWRANFQINRDAKAGDGYTLRVAAGKSDKFDNPIEVAATSAFQVTPVTVTPQITVLRGEVERANPDRGLSVNVRLTYPSGAPLDVADLQSNENPEGVLQGALFDARGHVPGSLFLGVPAGNGVWEFQDQILPRDTPIGQVSFRLLAATANPRAEPPNPLRTDFASQPMTVHATRPLLQVSVPSGVLAGQEFAVHVNATYANQALLEHDDMRLSGRALLRVVPGDPGLVFDRDFEYDAARGLWRASYLVKPTDPVGKWTLTALFTDNWDNDNVTARELRVGLRVDTQLSATSIVRTGELMLTSQAFRPGSSEPLSGNLNVTVLDPTGKRLGPVQTLQPTTGGKYQAKVVFPADAVLGTYAVHVRAVSGTDRGFDAQSVQVSSSGLQVRSFNTTAGSVARLDGVGVQVQLAYPNGHLADATKVTPNLRFQPAGAAPPLPVPLTYDAARQAWTGDHTPAVDSPTGPGRFVLAANDTAGNRLEDFLSASVRVDPAPIQVTTLTTLRAQHLRGETVTLRANLAYADGSIPLVQAVPATLRLGNTTIATLDLRPVAAGVWEGTSGLALDAPLSTPGQPWRAVIAQDAVRDMHGNRGPALAEEAAPFQVRPALLGLTILDQTPLPSGGLRVTFAITAPDGTRALVPVEGLRAYIVRNGQVSNETLMLVARTDSYVVTLSARDLLGGEYAIRLEGSDALGNLVTPLDSQPFALQSSHASKESPSLPLGLGFAALALVAGAHRRLARRP